jgi:HPt (histidine-containing phosphotransfer) domain-containing protein
VDVDEEEVRTCFGGNPDLWQKVVALFLKESPRLLADVETAIAKQDAGQLQRAAHTLKGSVGALGAKAAFDAAQRLETQAREGDLSHAEEAGRVLRAALQRLGPALSATRVE